MRAAATSFALLLAAISAISGNNPEGANTYVKFSASLRPALRDRPGTVQFELRPNKGIHINLEPPISVAFDTASPVKATGKLDIPRLEKVPYLDPARPIVQRVTLPKRSGKDTLTLRGTLTYFYCSDAEGWCSKFKQPFVLTLPAAR